MPIKTGHVQFCICLKNSFSNKLPEMPEREYHHVITLLFFFAAGNSQRLNSGLAEILIWFKMSILIYSYDSSDLKITWHFKPRNISNNFRDVCTIALILCFLIALVSQAVKCSTSRGIPYGNTEFKNTIPWKAKRKYQVWVFTITVYWNLKVFGLVLVFFYIKLFIVESVTAYRLSSVINILKYAGISTDPHWRWRFSHCHC